VYSNQVSQNPGQLEEIENPKRKLPAQSSGLSGELKVSFVLYTILFSTTQSYKNDIYFGFKVYSISLYFEANCSRKLNKYMLHEEDYFKERFKNMFFSDVYLWVIVGVVSALAITVSVIVLVVWRKIKCRKQNSAERPISTAGKAVDEIKDIPYYEEYLVLTATHDYNEEGINAENEYINMDHHVCFGQGKRESTPDSYSLPVAQYENHGTITSQQDMDTMSDQEPQYENIPYSVYCQNGPKGDKISSMNAGVPTSSH